MKRAASFLILIATTLVFSPISAQAGSEGGVLVVKIKDQKYGPILENYANQVELLFDETYRINVSDKSRAMSELDREPWVAYVESDRLLNTTMTAADPLFVLDEQELTKQWYLPKIQADKAWNKTTGSNLIIAIIDTGINAKHEDMNDGRVIAGYATYCQVENAETGDCLIRVSGDLAANVNSDDNGHGTIVAGIIGAISNNNRGIAGINWHARLMPIKALDSTGTGYASDVALALRWAADHGARVANLSIGGPGLESVQVLQDSVTYAFNKGVLIVVAAGNDAAAIGGNLNTNPSLPVCANGGQNMIVGVAAVDAADRKALFSNYGSNCVDISAPGTGTFVDKQTKQGLVSTYYDPTRPGENNLYVYALGTSMATPMVSAVASLMMDTFPELDVRAIRDRLISSADNIDQLNQTGCDGSSCAGHIGQGRLNAYKAVYFSTIFATGSVVRNEQNSLFLIEQGIKRPLSEYVYKQRFGAVPVIQATTAQLDTFPTGTRVPPADGTLIKEPNIPTVYLVGGGQRLALSYLAFTSRGFRFQDIVTLPAEEIAGIPPGQDADVLDGALMKSPDHPAVFILTSRARRLLSYFVFKERGFDQSPIAIISLEELAKFPVHPDGFLYPPAEGTLMRGDEISTVFMIEGGKRRGLNLPAFQTRGFRFEDVKVLSQSEVSGYELGTDIIE
ncbi:MAG: S8 family serine peptidase [bacterium]|nr:S8 family serine peptidase [bacterium]